MAVHLVQGVQKLIDKGGDMFAKKVVMTEKSLAPWDSGRLASSITAIKTGLGSYTVTSYRSRTSSLPYRQVRPQLL